MPAAPVTPVRRDPPEEDDLDELPALDDDAAPAPEAHVGDLLDEEDGDASLDDSTGEGDDDAGDELVVDEREAGWLGEPNESPDLDLGDAGMIDLADLGDGDMEEPGVEGQDFGLQDGPEHGGLDTGDEGPVGDDEELREEDLPDLDADEEGDVQDATLMDKGFAADEPAGLAWAAQPWVSVGAPVPFAAAVALACASRGALVAGRGAAGGWELSRVDLEGGVQALAAEGLDVAQIRRLEVDGDQVVAALESGAVFASRDGGGHFEPRTEAGPTADATLAALREGSEAPDAGTPAVIAQRGGRDAYARRRGGVVVRVAGGAWKTLKWEGRVTALVFVDDQGTLLATAYSDADDTTALVRLDESGVASVVARVGAVPSDPDSDGLVVAMAHDAAHGVVWLAGGFGVAAFALS